MTDIRDKAEGSDRPEVRLASDQPHAGAVHLSSSELLAADDVTEPGEFPQYGDFVQVVVPPEDGQEAGEIEYWECPAELADEVVSAADEHETDVTGLVIDVRTVAKTPDGQWSYDVAVTPE